MSGIKEGSEIDFKTEYVCKAVQSEVTNNAIIKLLAI